MSGGVYIETDAKVYKKMGGIRRYLFWKVMLDFTKGNGWYQAVFNIATGVRVY